LVEAGFVQLVASKPLALRALAREDLRSREREEKKKPVAHAKKPKSDEHRENAGAYAKHQPGPADPVDPEIALELARQLAGRYAR
jgi:hypothetical protein